MRHKVTQKDRVVKRLKDVGQITRNECLRNYISRLGAIICDLTKEGWSFDTKNVKGDYVYVVTKAPYRKVTYTLPTGETITATEKV